MVKRPPDGVGHGQQTDDRARTEGDHDRARADEVRTRAPRGQRERGVDERPQRADHELVLAEHQQQEGAADTG